MGDADAARGQVADRAAEVYDELFVPALFGQWTDQVLDAVEVRSGDRLLDVGCGTGVLARAATARVGRDGEVVGLDRNTGMLAVAARRDPGVVWEEGLAEHLPFPDARFDRIVSQFVLMFLEDGEAALREVRRVLAPGGTVAVATWTAVDESPGYASMVDLVRRTVSAEAAEALLVPFSLGTPAQLEGLLEPTLGPVEVRRCDGTARFPSIRSWVHTDVRGWTLGDLVDDATEAKLVEQAEHALAEHVVGDEVRFAAPALIATASPR